MSNTTTLLRWTRFASDCNGTGPEKRSAQIQALCQSAGLSLHDMVPPQRVSRWDAWSRGVRARLRLGALASVDRAGIGLLGYRAAFYEEALACHAGAKVLLWETTYDSLLPLRARQLGFRVIALPHNLESLVTQRAYSDGKHDIPADLAAEIQRLGLADAVFTISKEEQWLLNGCAISADYLPFHPNEQLAADCARIRAQRENTSLPSAPLLLLGSAFNPATLWGMEQQLAWLSHSTGQPVIVAGPETDHRLKEYASGRIQVLGRVSRAEVENLLRGCRALLIHTVRGGGAVTRIPEALLAGVPVIANVNAARDQHGTPGVHVYEDREQFLRLVQQSLPTPPAPPRPQAAEGRFIETLRAFL